MDVETQNPLAVAQNDVHSLPGGKRWDVVVVGAGPAGCAAALTLAKKGWDVLLIDRAAFPREKVCGDGFITDTVNQLSHLGAWNDVARRARPCESLRLHGHAGVETVLKGRFHTLRRSVFDAILANNAIERGVTFAQASVEEIKGQPDGSVRLRVRDFDNGVKATAALVATGVSGRLLKPFAMIRPKKPNALAMRAYVKAQRDANEFHVIFNRQFVPGYGWIFPMGNGVHNVGCGLWRLKGKMADLKRFTHWFLHENPTVRRVLGDIDIIEKPLTAPLRCGLQRVIPANGVNVLPAGEILGATLPFTGEGIGKALTNGVLAANTLDDALRTGDFQRLTQYPVELRRALAPSYRGYMTSQLAFSIPALGEWILTLMKRHRSLRRYCELILDDQFPPLSLAPIKHLLGLF